MVVDEKCSIGCMAAYFCCRQELGEGVVDLEWPFFLPLSSSGAGLSASDDLHELMGSRAAVVKEGIGYCHWSWNLMKKTRAHHCSQDWMRGAAVPALQHVRSTRASRLLLPRRWPGRVPVLDKCALLGRRPEIALLCAGV